MTASITSGDALVLLKFGYHDGGIITHNAAAIRFFCKRPSLEIEEEETGMIPFCLVAPLVNAGRLLVLPSACVLNTAVDTGDCFGLTSHPLKGQALVEPCFG